MKSNFELKKKKLTLTTNSKLNWYIAIVNKYNNKY